MKDIIPLSKQGKWEHDCTKLMIAGEELLPEEYSLILEPRAARGANSLSNNQGMISLDLEITKELEDEGIARDIIRLIQQARKEADFNVSDRIHLELKSNLDLVSVLKEHGQLISEQTLSVFSQDFQADYKTQVPLLNQILEIAIKR
jgi:isoleucyl-tRNA synthetase